MKLDYADALSRTGRNEKAIAFLEKATVLPSEGGNDALASWIRAWRGVAEAALARGDKAAAKAAVAKALSFPENLGRGKPYDKPEKGTPDKPGLLSDWPDSLLKLVPSA